VRPCNYRAGSPSMPASHPCSTRVRCRADAVPELRHMMLKMAKTDDLMLHFGNLVPRKSAVRVVHIEHINRRIDRSVADVPVGQYLLLRVWLSRLRWTVRQLTHLRAVGRAFLIIHELNSSLVMFPRKKGLRIPLQIEMRVIQRVVSDPPERVAIVAARP